MTLFQFLNSSPVRIKLPFLHFYLDVCLLFFQSFIEDLHELHEDWLMKEKYPVPAPVLVSFSQAHL